MTELQPKKDQYAPPECEVLEINPEGVIASSPDPNPGSYNNPFENGGTW